MTAMALVAAKITEKVTIATASTATAFASIATSQRQ